MKTISPKMMRRRKFLLVLPLLAIPFLTMAFWALGGGKAAPSSDGSTPASGLNPDLPGASPKEDKALDKMGYYDKAANDSLKLLEQMKNDPYFTRNATAADSVLDAITANVPADITVPVNGKGYTSGSATYSDPNEAKVYAKLGQLNAAMKDAANLPKENPHRETAADYSPQAADMEKLEQMMQAGGNTAPGSAADPEMKQLGGMLEKILDIQHPERVAEKMKAERKDMPPGERLAVSGSTSIASFSLIDTGNARSSGGFFGLTDKPAGEAANAVEAVVHESQTLVTGAVIKLRLAADAIIGGHRIPKGNFVYGTVSLNRERLEVSVSSIRYGESLYPVKLEVFDMDGLEGIYIPGAIGRDVAKQSSDNALQALSLGTIDPSPGAQAASAGIETAKNLLSRKVKLIKVQVKAGYKILLKNNSN